MASQSKTSSQNPYTSAQLQDLRKRYRNTGGSTSGSSTTPPPPPTTPSTTPTTTAAGSSANLQPLLAAIPIAVDGQVIAADHHNSLRAALIAMAGEMGMGLTAPTTTFTFMPAFLQSGILQQNWTFDHFAATTAITNTNPDGWLPVQLPDGQRIQSMTVSGKRIGGTAPKNFQVKLLRQLITGPESEAPTVLITLALEALTGPFSVSGSVIPAAMPATAAVSLITQAAAEEQKLIDTSNYKYFVQATATTVDSASSCEIDAIQITVSQ